LLEQIVVQLEIGQVDEFATVAPRDIPRAFQFVGNRRRFRRQLPAIAAADRYCFLVCHAYSSLQPRLCSQSQCMPAPKVKIGIYKEIRIPPTNTAMTIRISGSISAMAALIAVCTSSS